MQRGGIILCGGRSRRMGEAKEWLDFAGEPLLARIARQLSPLVAKLVVVAAADQKLPALPREIHLAHDRRADGGPMEGLAVGLRALGNAVEAAFVTTCDAPFVVPAVVDFLFAQAAGVEIVMPRDVRLHPLTAIYRPSVVPTLERQLELGQLRLMPLADLLPTRIVPAEELRPFDPQLLSLTNVNTPEEYEAALKQL